MGEVLGDGGRGVDGNGWTALKDAGEGDGEARCGAMYACSGIVGSVSYCCIREDAVAPAVSSQPVVKSATALLLPTLIDIA